MVKKGKATTIWVSQDLKKQLQSFMKYGETYDGIIRLLIDKSTCPLCGKLSGDSHGVVHEDCANYEAMKADIG